uniref:AA_permease domain-containing protein n=1 Tax=Ascaris lumbricoides TaxID=6252 RepID=A0A0M3I2G5_ASCLU
MGLLRERFFRLKSADADPLETRLRRCLTTTDITLLGVGHMIGAGIYVLTGSVVRNSAGPSIVISFALAGIASLLSALCYAEFGARFPKAGSAYTYAYIGVGELWAFIIGWNIILEHMLGAAAVARSWSGYLDSLLGNAMKNSTFINMAHFDASFFADYPDLIAFAVVVAVAIFVALGSKTSTNFNSIFTLINMLVIMFVVVYGFTFADFSLWSGTDEETGHARFMPFGLNGLMTGAASCFFAYIGFDGLATAGEEASGTVIMFVVVYGFTFADFSLWSGTDEETGHARFMPFGLNGLMTGAASCFFAYIGFDGLATAGEEASDPSRAIPLATFISMSIVTAAYILMSAALTLMVPFREVNPTAAFSDAFASRGAEWAKYLVSVGALSGMTTSLVS